MCSLPTGAYGALGEYPPRGQPARGRSLRERLRPHRDNSLVGCLHPIGTQHSGGHAPTGQARSILPRRAHAPPRNFPSRTATPGGLPKGGLNLGFYQYRKEGVTPFRTGPLCGRRGGNTREEREYRPKYLEWACGPCGGWELDGNLSREGSLLRARPACVD